MDLVQLMYEFTKEFPREELFGLVSQMRRAAVSIPSNIAEGSRRRGKDARNFLVIAYGSGAEIETQIEICRRLKLGTADKAAKLALLTDEIMRMLNAMINKKD